MRGEGGEEPGGGVQAGPDLLLLQVAVQVPVVVVEQPRQLVHLDLTGHTHMHVGEVSNSDSFFLILNG